MNMFFVFALTEVKQSLKLQRTKAVLFIAFLVSASFYVLVELQYILRAAESASVGIMAPTYIAATLGPYFIALYCIAMILLAYDLRGRDIRNKIDEVLDVVPASNIVVLLARLLGLVILIAVPMVVFIALIVLYGWIAEMNNLGYGNLIELHSVASFLIWDLVPNLAFFGALTIFLSTIIRSRILVIALAIGGVVTVFWVFLRLPLDYAGVLVPSTGVSLLPSEIAPSIVSGEILLNRFFIVLLAASFVVLAGSYLPRPLVHRRQYTIGGISALALSCLLIGGVLGFQHLSRLEVQDWVRTHNAQELSTFPDITDMRGSVKVVPSRKVELDITIDLIPPEDNARDYVVLTLNPGYRNFQLWVDGEEITPPSFEKGILQVPLPTNHNSSVEVRVKAQGRPDARFAYLDAAVKSKDIAGAKVRNLFALGTENYIFHRDFVVLTSGIKWYPTSGAATGVDKLEVRPRDLFTVDLKVSVPRDWLVAGGGHRASVNSNDSRQSTYQIAPGNPVPEVTLVSSDFERASIEVEDIEFEVLFTKHHRRTFHDLSAIERNLKTRILSWLNWHRQARVVYPYEMFSLVEVPVSLRVYGGGWRMDTILGPPGMVMMRESSLPNTRISINSELNFDNQSDYFGFSQEDELHRFSPGSAISKYFNSNVFGEHPTIGFARNFVKYQTSTTETGATVLDHVVEELVQHLLFDFSIWEWDRIRRGPGRSFVFELALAHAKRSVFDLFDVGKNEAPRSREERALLRYNTRSIVWNDLEQYSLGELTTEQAPLRSLRVISAKSMTLSQIILEILGRGATARLIGQLSKTLKGESYSYDDLIQQANNIDLDIEAVLGDWLNMKGLPGFIVAEPSSRRLPDTESGQKRFEASVVLHNAEPFDGFVDVSYTNAHPQGHGARRWDSRHWYKAFLVRGNESVKLSIASAYHWPVDVMFVEPYLSLNRDAIRVDIPPVIDLNKIAETQQPYVVKTEWSPTFSRAVIVDDLDENFEIVYGSPPFTLLPAVSFLRELFGTSVVEEWDNGLPAYVFEDGEPPPKQRWVRRSAQRAYGKYRTTYAFIHHGREGKPSYAKYSATLPKKGRWRLEYHQPVEELTLSDRETLVLQYQGLSADWFKLYPAGNTRIKVVIGEREKTIEFNARDAEYGWHELGEFEVDSTETEVWISGSSDKKTIYADAIRWIPLD
ncbi:MAG: hypothetical protein F4W92_03840 [Gammaproteobacteria bacterium]|nr:hypothetical protein [Gammaproteobacteria bacterium]